jgi:Flp pilus assembly protein TadD
MRIPRVPATLSSVAVLFSLIAWTASDPGPVLAHQSGPTTAAKKPDPKKAAAVTWSHDIAPLVYDHCTTCHHPGGAGPFSLLTYADARRWAPQMVLVTQSHFMPPWLPEPGYGDFADVRRLTDHEQELIKQWAKLGTPAGDLKEAPTAPHYDAEWTLGKPDLILRVPQPFTLNAGGTDVFRNFILPYPLKQTHYIRALEIVPGTPQIVHHANIIIDRTASLRRQHPEDWQNGVPGMELLVDSGNTFEPDSHFLFWKPDTPVLTEPEGMPWRLDPGNDLILNMHLKPSGKPETLDAQVGLYFTDKPPTKSPMLLQLDRDDELDIPAGDSHFVVEDSLKLPVDVDVLGVYPHAHYLGHDLEGWAMLPDGQKKWLVWIRNWDIDRQSVYRYREPLFLPRGSVLHMRYTYDNSANNVHNPNSPPIEVRAGNRSVDEMSHLWVQVLPVNVAPNSPDPRLLLEEAWMRNRLSKSPDDKVGLYNLAAALEGKGEYAEADEVYERELRLDPDDSRTLTALGASLDSAGQWKQAEERFRSVLASHPDACDARFDLAGVELRHEELKSAEIDFRDQLKLCPEDAEVHADLGATLAKEGQNDAARAEFQSGLEMNPENEEALLGEGEIDANSGDPQKAIAVLTKAVQLRPSSIDAHEQLARAYAQAGEPGKALDELRAAVRIKPDDPLLHSAISQVLAATGSFADAVEEQRAALKLLEDDPDGWNNLGVLEARTGKTASARADFEHALKLQPDHAEAKANLARLQGHN